MAPWNKCVHVRTFVCVCVYIQFHFCVTSKYLQVMNIKEPPPIRLLPDCNLHLWWRQMSAIKNSDRESMQHHTAANWSAFSTMHRLWAAVVWFSRFKATLTWSIYTECSTAYRVQNITILLSATFNKNVMWTRSRLSPGNNATCFKILYDIAHAERDGTCAETRFRLSPKRTSPFKSVGASVHSTAGSQGVRISLSNVG